jgi:hypothetical protein
MSHTLQRFSGYALRENGLWLSDTTVGDATTARHGLLPKLPNDATKYIDGTGAWSVPAGGGGGGGGPIIETAYATSTDAHSTNSATEDINSMSLSITTAATGKLFCTFDFAGQIADTQWTHAFVRFVLDAAGTPVNGDYLTIVKKNESDGGTLLNRIFDHHLSWVFTGVSAATHTVKVQWSDQGSSLNYTFYERRLTVMSGT